MMAVSQLLKKKSNVMAVLNDELTIACLIKIAKFALLLTIMVA